MMYVNRVLGNINIKNILYIIDKMNDKDVIDIFKNQWYKRDFKKYLDENRSRVNDMLKYLENVELNPNYYKVKILNNTKELKIKNINGYLNKLTSTNHDEIAKDLLREIEIDETLLKDSIEILIEKCILQKKYIKHYVDIILIIKSKYNIDVYIKNILNVHDKLFDDQFEDQNSVNYEKQYKILCEKNKKADNLIGYCETIFLLEKHNIIKDKCENIINIILLKINESLSKELEDETIKYISCLYNIYSQNKSCPSEICLKLKQLKQKTKVKKIIFKIMDILDLNE